MNDNIDVKDVEYKIYTSITQDFAEYVTNRMKCYQGVIMHLDSITLQHLNNTTCDKLYEEYAEFCKQNNFIILKPKTYSRTMCTMGGFIQKKKTKRNGKDKKTGKEIRETFFYYEYEV